jgi:hypothetical protein
VFGVKKEEVTEGWRKLNSGGYHNVYYSPNTSGNQIKWNENHESSRTRSIYEQNTKCIQSYIWTTLKEKTMYGIQAQIREQQKTGS